MKGVGEGQDVDFLFPTVGAPIAPGKLEGAFVGLGAAVAEMHLVGKGGFAQKLRQAGVGRGVVEVAHMQNP